MARKITVVVETGRDMFSCFMSGASDLPIHVIGDGKTVRGAMEDFRTAFNEAKEYYEEQGTPLPELEFDFVLDVGAFLNYYPINVTAFAEYIGMNTSLLRQYTSGLKVPKDKNLGKIRDGIQRIAKDIAAGHLIDKPVSQYI